MNQHLDLELSAWVDGELAGDELARVEAHLAECAECRARLEDLNRLVRRAGALDDRPPERDLWPRIASRLSSPETRDVIPIESARRRRRLSFTVPQLAAAALALMAVTAGMVTILAGRGPSRAGSASSAGTPTVGAAPASFAGQPAVDSYDAAIRGLEATLAARRGQLDTATVRVVEQSLAIIDAAIAQARAALLRDPNNTYLNRHLQRALDRKLDVLRQVATLPVS